MAYVSSDVAIFRLLLCFIVEIGLCRYMSMLSATNIFVTGLALVDCSASSETIGVLKLVVDLGCCIVLANKKPLTSTMVIKSSRWIETITFEYYYLHLMLSTSPCFFLLIHLMPYSPFMQYKFVSEIHSNM